MRERHSSAAIRPLIVAALLAASFGCGGSTSVPTSSTPLPTPLPAPPPTSPRTTVTIVAGASALTTTAYAPSPLNIAVGEAVLWVNSDLTTHTATADGGAFNSGPMAPGRMFSQTFTTAGTFSYRCAIHPGMMGTITVQ